MSPETVADKMDARFEHSMDRSFASALIDDGRPLLRFAAAALLLSGGFAIFQSATGHFLPQDVAFLGMTSEQLCALHECRIVHFMFHDRVSFGGVLIAIATLYLWLCEFPLRDREPWAWWLFALSSVVGVASFLAYLGYGYLDQWHGVATLALLPVIAGGLWRTARELPAIGSWRSLLKPGDVPSWRSRPGIGRLCLLGTGVGMIGAGSIIMTVGMTVVFVPEDLVFMRLEPAHLNAINPRLIPLIAHDRAGFGGGLLTTGFLVLGCVWCGRPSRALWQALLAAGTIGFACAIGIHPLIGYNEPAHLAPAWAGAGLFTCGLWLSRPAMCAPCSAQ